MKRACGRTVLGLVGVLMLAPWALAQTTPYIGFAFPAGGERGTTFQVRLGGQRIDGITGAVVSGEGVTAKLVEYRRQLSNQEMTLLREQQRELRPNTRGRKTPPLPALEQKISQNIQVRVSEWVNTPACAALSSIAVLEVTIASDAEPGPRELRLLTVRGATNPLVFCVGQVPEVARKPMLTCRLQVLGKEQLSLRQRPEDEVEMQVTVPCTMNGQIASGEVNHYRFAARQGQRLVISVKARELIPFIADAVPGWFQPVLMVCDAEGNELAFNDDFRFKPDPTLLFDVPADGQYLLKITDAIYRGREDFVYRITIGELPFLTSIFPLGAQVGQSVAVQADGWHLDGTELALPGEEAPAGLYWVTARQGDLVSNRVPFVRSTLPECLDQEANDDAAHAQRVTLPMVVNGRIDRADDWDVFVVKGTAGQSIVAEVLARRLDTPLDSVIKITDEGGNVLAVNDDHEDPGAGINTHHADSFLMFKFPADGKYFIHIGDTTRRGGPAYAYRLRLSQPEPDFELRVVPSSLSFRAKGSATVTVHAVRKEGFSGDIRIDLKDAPAGFVSRPVVMKADQDSVRFSVRATRTATPEPVPLHIVGMAQIGTETLARDAVPAEDCMQAFLWRHLVPADELLAFVYDPNYEPPLQRTPNPTAGKQEAKVAAKKAAAQPLFNKRQVAGRLRQLKALYEEYLLTDAFYNKKVAECETVLD